MDDYRNNQSLKVNNTPSYSGDSKDESADSKNNVLADNNKYLSGALQSRNVRIYNRRTSVRLEPEMWSALSEIAALEGCSIHDLCGVVYDMKGPGASFTAALRVFMMEYYRSVYRTNDKINLAQQKIRAMHKGSKPKTNSGIYSNVKNTTDNNTGQA